GCSERGAGETRYASLRRHYPHRYQGCDLTAPRSFSSAKGPLASGINVTPIASPEQPAHARGAAARTKQRTFPIGREPLRSRLSRCQGVEHRGTSARGEGGRELTTAKPTAGVLDVPRAGVRWWLVAATLLGLGLAAVLTYALARFGEGRLAG